MKRLLFKHFQSSYNNKKEGNRPQGVILVFLGILLMIISVLWLFLRSDLGFESGIIIGLISIVLIYSGISIYKE